MKIVLQFQIRLFPEGGNRYGIELIALDPDGNALGRPALVVQPGYASAEEAAERLVGSVRQLLNREYMPGHRIEDFLFAKA